ncbi:uncharacterized protein BT62DRAFT_996458 [Guyanagaster necrorhizus]|uniref:Uncharacterized protein n=1 Tax=Guyanagaster necrorhizus TaxID=856835 RepID=A0A9P7VLH7_9AGAR|nr:uncharacterized protein BT62DRAFT_996458 [Guyanagaster necrorhizus MCA 3950]KAG7442735.1 hypothetical protein BT62DRAFT_996458 [Guyanagaster necrorhizus MCA 3950]
MSIAMASLLDGTYHIESSQGWQKKSERDGKVVDMYAGSNEVEKGEALAISGARSYNGLWEMLKMKELLHVSVIRQGIQGWARRSAPARGGGSNERRELTPARSTRRASEQQKGRPARDEPRSENRKSKIE